MNRRRIGLRLLQLVLLALVGYGLYRALAGELSRITWADIRAVGTPAAAPLALSTLMLVAVYLVHGLLWRRIVRDLDGGTAQLRPSLYAYFVSSLGRYIPGRLWQLAGLAVLSARAGLAPSRAMAASVFGQVGFLTTGLLFLAFTLPDLADTLSAEYAGAVINPLLLASVLLAAVALTVWVLAATRVGHALRDAVTRRLGSRMGERVATTLRIADQVAPARALAWAAGYAASWLVLGTAFVLFVSAFAHVPGDALVKTAGTVAAAYLVGYLFLLTPAGLGIREGAMFVLLGQFLAPTEALVVAVLSRVWFTAAELLPIALLPLLPGGTAAAPHPNGVP